MIEYFNYIFILTIVVLGGFIVVSDIKTGKIRNKHIVLGFTVGFVLHLMMMVVAFFLHNTFDFYSLFYYREMLVNFVLSIVAGYLLWYWHFWSAGDAKFFIMIAFLLPLYSYSHGFIPYFPSFALLYNIFIPALIYLLFFMIIEFLKDFQFNGIIERIKIKINSYREKDKNSIIVRINLFFIMFIMMAQTRVFIKSFGVNILYFAVVYYVKTFVDKIKNKKVLNYLAYIFTFITVALVALFFMGIFKVNMLISSLPTFIIMMIAVELSDYYIKKKEIIEIPLSRLGKGMVLADNQQDDKVMANEIGEVYPEGLSEEQSITLRRIWKVKNEKPVKIYRTASFGIWIYIGAIITIIIQKGLSNYF